MAGEDLNLEDISGNGRFWYSTFETRKMMCPVWGCCRYRIKGVWSLRRRLLEPRACLRIKSGWLIHPTEMVR